MLVALAVIKALCTLCSPMALAEKEGAAIALAVAPAKQRRRQEEVLQQRLGGVVLPLLQLACCWAFRLEDLWAAKANRRQTLQLPSLQSLT